VVEQDPDDWWRATCQAVREALAKVPHGRRGCWAGREFPGAHLAAAGCIRRPLRPAMIWMDRRAEAESARLTELLGADEIHRITATGPTNSMWPRACSGCGITNPRF